MKNSRVKKPAPGRLSTKAGLVVGGLLMAGTAGCGLFDNAEPQSGGNVTATSQDDQAAEIPDGYTIFSSGGAQVVEGAFDVRLLEIADGTGYFAISDNSSDETRDFPLALDDSAEYGGWTFEVVYLGNQTAIFTATSPEGITHPVEG